MKNFLKVELINTGTFILTVGNVVNALIIFFTTYLILKFISAFIKRIVRKKGQPDSRHLSIIKLLKYFVWIIAIIFMLQALEINITFLIASSAALLVGIGLGLQDVFKDFISGIALLIEGTIKVDDVVEVDGLVVQVNEISIRTSKVTTREDIVVIIPNHKFIQEKIINWTHNALPTRFMIEVGVDYASDVRLVEKILIECAVGHKDILTDSSYMPSVRLKDFGSSSIDFQLFFYSFNLFRIENVKSQIRFDILKKFRSNSIQIPFTQLVLHRNEQNQQD